MKVFAETGDPSIASVYMAEFGNGQIVEFVEALQPPFQRSEKWILMVSTLFGCPIKCLICDAGGQFHGKPTKDQILEQIDYLVLKWFPDGIVPAEKFKIQFARMGEPSLNPAVLDVLEILPNRYTAPGLIPSLSTIAPHGTDPFFERLIDIKDTFYPKGRFQFQFSIHTTNEEQRDEFIPVRKWNFSKMEEYGNRFLKSGDRKITLNFAWAKGMALDVNVLLRYFDPEKYLIKITPVNPTCQAVKNGYISQIDPSNPIERSEILDQLNASRYEVIISVGEVEENKIGSNCGQYVLKYLESQKEIINGYSYPIQTVK